MDEGDGCCVFQKEKLSLTFMLWDCSVSNVTMGCCAVDRDSVFVIMHYDDSFGATKMFKGEAWVADSICSCKNQMKAGMSETTEFFEQMKSAKDEIKAFIVYDGQLSVDQDFDLHLHFDHPIKKRSLLVKDVAKGKNPLLVIDSFS
jgi:hypothetical protein